jgi:hypothetical protein
MAPVLASLIGTVIGGLFGIAGDTDGPTPSKT